ncbi:21163_t:CDS:2 [Dentiscutata erythropus]|uniref:21163_t:CDS:1 n=1 Tax=Dentiscutata erythropus TaxID=1348616 RepID=A0A9N9N9A2_9GLOM|nr:21163_t:CDS:2 [Dentiscutata erythropus]
MNKLQEEKYFNDEIDKIDEKTYLYEKQFLRNLKEQINEMYNDKEKDHYFIDLEDDEIYQESGVAWMREIKENKENNKEKGKKHNLEDKDISDPKRRNKRIMKPEKEYNKKSISFVRSILVKCEFMEDVSPLTISAIFDIYKESTAYSSALATLIDFYKKAKARYFTKLDIVYKILVLQSPDLELNELIENIFDGLEV